MSTHRYIALSAAGLVAAGAFVGYLMLMHPASLPWCDAIQCSSQRVVFGFAKPLYKGTWPLCILFLGIAFADRATFLRWARLFGITALVPFCLILAAEPIQTGFFPGPFPDRTGMTLAMSVLLAALSVVYLAVRYVRRMRVSVH